MQCPKMKDFSEAHIGCMNSKTMHPAKYLCTFPFLIILKCSKKACISGCMGIKIHADEGQTMSSGAGAPLVSDTACWFLLNAILKQLCNIKAIDDSLSV